MKRRIWQTDRGNVCLRQEDPITGDEIIRQFWVAVPYNSKTGYVYEYDRSADFQRRQVCGHLSSRGYTLRSTDEGLLDLIRREYRRSVAAERRERNRW